MYFCNKCDRSFGRKDNLVRHHRKYHDDEVSLASLLRNLGYSSKSEKYEPKQKRARTDESDMSEDHATDYESEADEENETDAESVAPASSSDSESGSVEDIEDHLNDEDESTPSLYPLRDIWELTKEEAERCYDGNVVQAYIDQVRLGRQLKADPVHKKVMETMESLQKRDPNMDFEEALVKAANRRKHIIEQAAADTTDEAAAASQKTN